MKKVYIDYNQCEVYWSIEDIKRNPKLLKEILAIKTTDSDLLRLAKNEISFNEIINIAFKDDVQGDYQIVETDSKIIYVDWNDCIIYTDLDEVIDSYSKTDIFNYVAESYDNDFEKLYNEIRQGLIDIKQVYASFVEDKDYIGIYVRK